MQLAAKNIPFLQKMSTTSYVKKLPFSMLFVYADA